MTEHTKKGARGLILPASTEIGNPAEDTLLPGTVAELQRLGIRVQEVALDGGFNVGPTTSALEDLAPKNVFIAGRQEPGPTAHPRRRCGATARARKAGSVTSNAATGWTDPPERRPRPADLD